MTKIDNSLINKIKALLNKTVENGCSLEESASAFGLAQKMIDKNRLSMMDIDSFDIDAEEEVFNFGSIPGSESLKTSTWKNHLAMLLAKANGCKVYLENGNMRAKSMSSVKIIGRNSDVQVVNYLFMFMSNEIERLCKFSMRHRNGSGKSWSNSFKIGAVTAISEKLQNGKKEAEIGASEVSIVRVNDRYKEVEEFASNNLNLKKRPTTAYQKVDSAYNYGYEAGSKIQVKAGLSGVSIVKQLCC